MPRLRRKWPGVPLSYAVYQAIALGLWWRMFAAGRLALPAGSADPGQEVWFLAWVPHALGAATNPFFSRALFSPHGVNMLSNTSTELIGLLLSPVTVTAGPVVSFWVAVVVAPALSALGAFALVRRHVRWQPAAFIAGLGYGFGPFAATDLRYGHLDLTWLVLPPLIFLALEELLFRRERRPARVGLCLGLLVVAQFFVSTEFLAITAITGGAAILVAAVAWPRSVPAALRAAWRGIFIAAIVVGGALAYPCWVVVAGPQHFTGAVWMHVGHIATSLASTVDPRGQLAGVSFISGGNGTYLGTPLLVVLVLGAVFLWRSVALRFSLALAAITYVLSLGSRLHVRTQSTPLPLPAALLGHVPLLDSIVPERFAAMTDLFCALALAVVVDQVRSQWPPVLVRRGARRTASAPRRPLLHGALAVAVAAFAFIPLASVPHWPYRTTPVARPAVAASVETGTTAPPVLVVYPDTSTVLSELMVRQAQLGYPFALPDGYVIVPGPDGRAVESPRADALWLVFAAARLHRLHLPLSASARHALAEDLRGLAAHGVVVLARHPGSATVRRALTSVLGPPSKSTSRAATWAAPTGT